MGILKEKLKDFIEITIGSGYGDGDGAGSGYGSDSGSGSGSGYCYGSGSGFGLGYGDGAGSGYGSDSGSGYGYGYGSGYGYGYGSGSDSGSGYDDGDGYANSDISYLRYINNMRIYNIDNIPTIITSIHKNIAKGYIVRENLSLEECYIAKGQSKFAHRKNIQRGNERPKRKTFKRYEHRRSYRRI